MDLLKEEKLSTEFSTKTNLTKEIPKTLLSSSKTPIIEK